MREKGGRKETRGVKIGGRERKIKREKGGKCRNENSIEGRSENEDVKVGKRSQRVQGNMGNKKTE